MEAYGDLTGPDPVNNAQGVQRVLRGGSWYFKPKFCRSACRFVPPGGYHNNVGFRVGVAAPISASMSNVPGLKPERQPPAAQADPKAAKPWNSPAFQQWMKDVDAMPVEKQIEAVSKKLMELNPGYDGKFNSKVENGVVTDLGISNGKVTDISPLRAFVRLKRLECVNSHELSDISPLQGMQLTNLSVPYTKVADLTPLNGMNLHYLNCGATQVRDLS